MSARDIFGFAVRALLARRLRSALLLLAMAIGVASVVVLTSLGEGARAYVLGEFRSLGTHLLIVLPGRSETAGAAPPITGEIPRDLTIDDAAALARNASIRRVAPVIVGTAPVSRGARERDAIVVGSTADFLPVRNLRMESGRFLPAGDPRRAAAVCAIGARIRDELFPEGPAIGSHVRVGDRKFRVLGVVASRGRSLGLDLEDMVVIPVASAQQVFNTRSLFRILVEARSRQDLRRAEADVLATIRRRHEGEEDITVIAQDSVLGTFDRILGVLTMVVGGIAGISLVVAGILIMNVMLVAVSQRTAEVGLLKALGAPPGRILLLFLVESASLASAGGLLGLLAGAGAVAAIRWIYPSFPAFPPWWAAPAAAGVASITGVVFGILPARRAARLDPVNALARR